MPALIEAERIEAAYGPSQALFGVSLTVAEGEAVALMGRNGMGKTTTVRTLCRLLPLKAGRVVFAGTDLGPLPPHRAARLGIGLVPEGRRCFAPLTVAENLTAAARPGPWDLARVTRLFPRLGERMRQRAATLSGGEQQMLAIGRALMTNPRLLILDEATEGLAPVVRREIWAAIAEVKRSSMAILLIDKALAEVVAVADRAVMLDRGASVWEGPATAVPGDVAGRYLGV
ncbi:MAG: ABC transporter ATP-binding protein [Rhodobacteraceae bacterium]|jgi:branched-chain amino acid transport system ATP-binding protein|nr:ABC transporter ATP-binding protein [Paracoccaceae bacterium]